MTSPICHATLPGFGVNVVIFVDYEKASVKYKFSQGWVAPPKDEFAQNRVRLLESLYTSAAFLLFVFGSFLPACAQTCRRRSLLYCIV